MIREISTAVLACGLGLGAFGCHNDRNDNMSDRDTGYSSSGNMSDSSNMDTTGSGGHSGLRSGSGSRQGSSNRETTGGAMNNAGSMSKQAPTTQP